ncbi:MAG TPA: hypothetical protein VKW04_25445 [Planctomycetota bacterium]|nr:hypothetical protein [Planctomycetota bacterium]
MRRRLTTFVVAAVYLLQATWLLHAGADFVFPRLRPIAAAPDACCARACGCPEEAQRNRTCCCSKEASAEPRTATGPQPLSSIEEARCRGVESAMAQAFTQPVVCSAAGLRFPSRVHSLVILPEQSPVSSPRAAAPEKVPIAQA